jgi:hypothetical protein
VLVGQVDPTIIMVLNGKISSWSRYGSRSYKKKSFENFLATMSSVGRHKRADYSGTKPFTTLSKKCGKSTIKELLRRATFCFHEMGVQHNKCEVRSPCAVSLP